MRNLFMILIAGILTVAGFNVYAKETTTEKDCAIADSPCSVNITVEMVDGDATIVADPQTLNVTARDSEGKRRPVIIKFKLNTPGYSFAGNGITFADPVRAGGQFSPGVGGGPTVIVKKDRNTKDDNEKFEYSIMVKDQNNKVITKDPVIINGAH